VGVVTIVTLAELPVTLAVTRGSGSYPWLWQLPVGSGSTRGSGSYPWLPSLANGTTAVKAVAQAHRTDSLRLPTASRAAPERRGAMRKRRLHGAGSTVQAPRCRLTGQAPRYRGSPEAWLKIPFASALPQAGPEKLASPPTQGGIQDYSHLE